MIPIGVGGAFTVPAIAALIRDSLPGQLAGMASGVLLHRDGRPDRVTGRGAAHVARTGINQLATASCRQHGRRWT
jgi:hypothetical protein